MTMPDSSFRRPQTIEEMPDLSSLDNALRLNLLLNALSFKAGPSNVKASALWTGFIRLIDQLIRSYNAARVSLQNAVDEPGSVVGPLFRATTQMEVCLFSLRRAVRFVKRLRLKRDCPACGNLEATTDRVLERLTRILSTVETVEERILNREIEADDPAMLTFTSVGIEIGDERISYSELADWIGELYALAIEMTDYKDA